MWERIEEHLYSQPRRMISYGRACISVGLFMLMAGVIGWAVKGMLSVVARRTGVATPQSLSELTGLPMLTWLIPESVFGVVVALVFVGLGLWLKTTGAKLAAMV